MSRALRLGASVAIAGLVACGGVAGAKTKVKIWTPFGGDYGKVLQRICAGFEKANPGIVVEYSAIPNPGEPYDQKLLAAVAGGVGPDLVWVSPERVTGLYDGVVMPLSQLQKLSARLNLTDFYSALVDPKNHYRKTVWGIPFENNNLALFYSKSLFAAAGLAGPPRTWTEMTQAALKLTRKDTKQFGIELPFVDWYCPMWYAQKGVPIIDDTRIAFDSPAGVEAMTWYTELHTRYKVVGGGFGSGKAAMHINAGNYRAVHPKSRKADLGVAPLPYADDGQVSSLIPYKELIVLKSGDSKRAEAAWRLAAYMVTSDAFADWCITSGYLPVTRAVANTDTYRKYVQTDPGVAVLLEQSNTGCMMPVLRGGRNVWPVLQQAIDSIVSGKKSVKQALSEATRRAQAFTKAK